MRLRSRSIVVAVSFLMLMPALGMLLYVALLSPNSAGTPGQKYAQVSETSTHLQSAEDVPFYPKAQNVTTDISTMKPRSVT